MSDALGGVVNVALIVFFIVLISGYMAFNVNYQKAFNLKNKIVKTYEEYKGTCSTECLNKIKDYEEELGYSKNIDASNYLKAGSGTKNFSKKTQTVANGKCINGYCVIGVDAQLTDDTSSDSLKETATKYCYFKVTTFVEINIPIINNLMGLSLFQVNGQTDTMKLTNETKSCEQIAKIS